MNNEQSSLVQKAVDFSVTKDVVIKGWVHERIDMKDKPDHNFTITGYLVEDPQGKLHSIAYWRVIKIHEGLSKQDVYASGCIPVGEIKGGYNRERREQNGI